MKSFVSKSSLTQIMRHSRPTLVISDWDETITEEDTIKYVAQVPYIKQRQQRVLPPFEKFVESYNQNYTNLKNSFNFPNTTTTSIECSNYLSQQIKFQDKLSTVENQSIELIEQSKIFEGLTKKDFQDYVNINHNKIKLRPGFSQFVKRCQNLNIPIIIVSANWTSIFIKQCLANHGLAVDDIITNELSFHSDDEEAKTKMTTTGLWDKSKYTIRTSQDKLDIVKQIQEEKDSLIMYIGDSGTDLLPLLNVDFPCAIKGSRIVEIFDKSGLRDNLNVGTWHDFINIIKE